ncbi:MAG: hypothetical protein JO219_10135 [Candidatus Eremiobacteraeota bacterium]|nr:hypothetical protein [Candidatus Eremiobacteraeota bacterium]
MYKEFLRVRHALMWFAITIGVTALGILIINTAAHSGHATIVLDHGTTKIHKTVAIPWVIWFAAAAWVAAIMSTILGSTLSQENDHLALAWTKPRSRTSYATALMLIDGAAILITQFVAFAVILVLFKVLSPSSVPLTSAPDDALNVVRFALFPLAWYALIVALSASLRNRAGIVQGLIWPVAIGLGSLIALPAPWRQIFGVINFVNPILYTSYHAGSVGSGMVIDTGGTVLEISAGVGALAFVAFVVLGWFAATYQWRRLEA